MGAPAAKTAKKLAPELAPKVTADPDGNGEVLIRRTFPWKDLKFLERLVRRGVPTDEDWASTWKEYCEVEQIPADFKTPPPKDALTKFVERNLHTLRDKEWAKEFFYRREGEDDEMPPSPVQEPEERPANEAAADEAPRERSASHSD